MVLKMRHVTSQPTVVLLQERLADIAAGDTLYWMGSVAGYELDATDDLDISYQASSDDV